MENLYEKIIVYLLNAKLAKSISDIKLMLIKYSKFIHIRNLILIHI